MQRYEAWPQDHPYEDDNGDYVLHSEAQSEISRIQAEVERLRKLTLTLSMERHVPAMRVSDKMHKQQAQATDDYMALLEQLKTARNDALEEAAKRMDLLYQKYKEMGEFTKCDAFDEAEQEILALIR